MEFTGILVFFYVFFITALFSDAKSSICKYKYLNINI